MRGFKRKFNNEVAAYARKNLDKSLKKQGMKSSDLTQEEYDELLLVELELLKEDAKKVGSGMVVGAVFTMLFGF